MTTCDLCGRQEADEAATLDLDDGGRERPAAHLLRRLLARAPARDGGQARQRVLVTTSSPVASASPQAHPQCGCRCPRPRRRLQVRAESTTVVDQVAGRSPSRRSQVADRPRRAPVPRARGSAAGGSRRRRRAACSTTSARRGSASPRRASTQRRQAVSPGTTNGPSATRPAQATTRVGHRRRAPGRRAGRGPARRRRPPAPRRGLAGPARPACSPDRDAAARRRARRRGSADVEARPGAAARAASRSVASARLGDAAAAASRSGLDAPARSPSTTRPAALRRSSARWPVAVAGRGGATGERSVGEDPAYVGVVGQHHPRRGRRPRPAAAGRRGVRPAARAAGPVAGSRRRWGSRAGERRSAGTLTQRAGARRSVHRRRRPQHSDGAPRGPGTPPHRVLARGGASVTPCRGCG